MVFKKSFFSILVLLVSAVLYSGHLLAQSEQEYQRSVEKISKEIKSLSSKLNKDKSKLQSEQNQLLEAEKELYQIQNSLKSAKQGIETASNRLLELEQQQQQALQQQDKSRSALADLIESNYKNGVSNQLKMVLNQENAYAVGRLNNYQSYFSKAIKQRITELQTQLSTLAELKVEQRKVVAEQQSLLQEQEFLERQQQQKTSQRKQALQSLNAKIASNEGKLKKLKEDRARLDALLKQLAKQRKELERLEQQRIEQERLAAEKAKQNNQKPKPITRKLVKGGFVKQKGRLSCPLQTSPKTKFGQTIVSSGMRSEGVFYTTASSTDVKSIFRGQVLFSDFLKGFGLMLIVDHGDDHISLYGHNEVLYKKVGDSVDTNEIISKTGTTGGLKSPGLYFEIRNNTTPVDPAIWCQ